MKQSLRKILVMKRIIPMVTIVALLAVFMVACRSKTATTTDEAKVSNFSDTVGLADFQAWKRQNELAKYNEYMQSQSVTEPQKAVVKKTAAKKTTTKKAADQTWSNTSESQDAAKAPAKKGWSKAAKGAVIGAGSGAVIGAVVNKRNRVVGAVIGGVIGGAGGYAIGRQMDKKDGRVNFN